MLLRTYITVTLFIAGAPQALARRAEVKRAQEGGLATLEWVALTMPSASSTRPCRYSTSPSDRARPRAM